MTGRLPVAQNFEQIISNLKILQKNLHISIYIIESLITKMYLLKILKNIAKYKDKIS